MRIVFAGSPQFAIPTLERLVQAGHEILAVYTQPDRPVGREQTLQPPPVKKRALELGLRIEQPERIRRDEPRAVLESLHPDVMVVVGYGQILPAWLLELLSLFVIFAMVFTGLTGLLVAAVALRRRPSRLRPSPGRDWPCACRRTSRSRP